MNDLQNENYEIECSPHDGKKYPHVGCRVKNRRRKNKRDDGSTKVIVSMDSKNHQYRLQDCWKAGGDFGRENCTEDRPECTERSVLSGKGKDFCGLRHKWKDNYK